MKVEYDLNLKLYEVGAVLSNVARWKGLLELKTYIERISNVLKNEEYELLKYGVALISDGRSPEEVDFFIFEVYEKNRLRDEKNHELHKDLRLIMRFIKWIQLGQHQSHTTLLNALDDMNLRSQYKNWISINEFDPEITFEQSKKLTTEEWLKVRESNPLVKNYYDNLFQNIGI